MTTIIRIAVPLAVLGVAAAQTTNMVNRRGQTPTQDPTQTLDRGRFGSQGAVPVGAVTLDGILVDAGCQERSALNLRLSPERPAPAAHGVAAAPRTLDAQREDAMLHQVPDLRGRQADLTCAITGSTLGFALLLDNGRLLNLDEGGNTMAVQAVQSSSAGRAMLKGNGLGIKPRVRIEGRVRGDRVMVESLNIN